MRIDKARAAAVGVEFMDFTWPEPRKLMICMRNVIDNAVDSHFYISDIKANSLVYNGKTFDNGGIAMVGRLSLETGVDQNKRVYGVDGIAPSLTVTQTVRGVKVLVDE